MTSAVPEIVGGGRHFHGQGLPLVPAAMVAAAAIVAAILSLRLVSIELPFDQWWQAAVSPVDGDLQQMYVHYIVLPRVAVSILAGAALALSGALFQQVLRNPLAEASTLGVSSGAFLALAATTLWFPDIALNAQQPVALAGAGAALALTFLLAWKGMASPLRLILAGLIVSLVCGLFTSVLSVLFIERLRSVFLWGSGLLVQNDWSAVAFLAPRFLACVAVSCVLLRPFTLLGLDDENARSLGLSLSAIRLIAMLLAVGLAAFVVSAVGVIGFIGIAAPAIVRMAGIRTFKAILIWAPVFGAVLLWLADQLTQVIHITQNELPAGVVTAVLGGPLMLWMLPRLKGSIETTRISTADIAKRLAKPWPVIGVGIVLLVLTTGIALFFGRLPTGWHWVAPDEIDLLMPVRAPRVTAALAAGAMLAVSGTLIQRMTGNAMASPEVLGISLGATLGVVLLFLFDRSPDHALKIAAAAAGAFLTLVLMLSLARSSAFSPERMLLTGVAMGTVVGAVLSLLMVSGDPRMGMLLAWMAGSTYAVTAFDARAVTIVAIILFLIIPLAARWLELLPLGEVPARELGVGIARARLSILLMTAILCGASTLIVGPLSFVGLMAPHIARLAGFQRPMSQLAASAVIGALIMVVADWLGRMILFPYQVPAGLLATAIGAPYFVWLMRRRPA
ncbi:MAG: Fe(3+)-hydroxamate ABC transporter permease FhuB [Pseudomonadota bacterium]